MVDVAPEVEDRVADRAELVEGRSRAIHALAFQIRRERLGARRALPADHRQAGVETETEVLDGDPPGRILELAKLRDVDLIVVGSRGLGPIAGTLLGSVSREVLHHADRPVLIAARRVARRRAA
jgi:nucleotide-binding universal stress UspA family protein